MTRQVSASLLVALWLVVGASACEPVKLGTDTPGPPGSGQRDPRQSGPSTMSQVQNKIYRENGSPDSIADNDHGGKDWQYETATGSVFGEQKKVMIYSFDAQGLLYRTHTDVLKDVGK